MSGYDHEQMKDEPLTEWLDPSIIDELDPKVLERFFHFSIVLEMAR